MMMLLRTSVSSWRRVGITIQQSTLFCSIQRTTTTTRRASSIRSFSTASSNDDSFTTVMDSLQGYSLFDKECNVTPNIASRVGMNLHHQPFHPLCTIKSIIQDYFQQSQGGFVFENALSPIVSVEANFDSLLIPQDHVSRSKSDTYYLDNDTVLRCHTSAHQTSLLKKGLTRFLVTGDVYRRDEVDSSHYPVFHQMEGVKLFTAEDYGTEELTDEEKVHFIEQDLKRSLEGMAHELFGNVQMRWVDEYFPFTDPSFELEIFFEDEWMEVLGCGVVRQEIIDNAGQSPHKGWAFGLGLERLAMVLFGIPDIRLFWTQDERFHSQFRNSSDKIVKFVPYSKYPPCYKDISFWTPNDGFHEHDVHELVRTVAGDLVEKVELIDSFVHPKTQRLSNCFRISYRSMDRSLTNEEVDAMQEQVRSLAVDELNVELR